MTERPPAAAPVPARRSQVPLHLKGVSCLASAVFHAALMLILAMIVSARHPGTPGTALTATMDGPEPLETLWEDAPPNAVDLSLEPGVEDVKADPAQAAVEVVLPQDAAERPSRSLPEMVGFERADAMDWLAAADARLGGGLEGRSPEARATMLARGGGNDQSEAAVRRGLRWLAAHQAKDGSWHFNLQHCNCQGYCRNPGTVATTTGATSLALLAFLGDGQTHLVGEHRDVVRQGLYYLGSRAQLSADGADLREGTMYAQGLAAIALCEAYAMSGDPGLKDLAQQSLRYIIYAQDKRGGGWRYSPGEPGDTTVTGWQMMALKSGQMAGLEVPSPAIFLAQRFLDSVQSDGGALYGYTNPRPRRATTAIGLLCRMYTGWGPGHEAIRRGVAALSQWGPSQEDMYYNYYATQVLFHWGGSDWQRWNRTLRDYLIGTQASQGHESGSWHFPGTQAAESAGRLYNTAMAVMILEVYYRYMPLYSEASVAR